MMKRFRLSIAITLLFLCVASLRAEKDGGGDPHEFTCSPVLFARVFVEATPAVPGGDSPFGFPTGMIPDDSIDGQDADNLYVTDASYHVVKQVIHTDAGITVNTLAGTGVPGFQDTERDPKTGEIIKYAQFNHPAAIVVDAEHNLYVADAGNACIRKIDPAGNVTTLKVKLGDKPMFPRSLAFGRIDRKPILAVADTNNEALHIINLDNLSESVTFPFTGIKRVDWWLGPDLYPPDGGMWGEMFITDDNGINRVSSGPDGGFEVDLILDSKETGIKVKSLFSDDRGSLYLTTEDNDIIGMQRVGFRYPTRSLLTPCNGAFGSLQTVSTFFNAVMVADTEGSSGTLQLIVPFEFGWRKRCPRCGLFSFASY
jgi:hypothetical protein